MLAEEETKLGTAGLQTSRENPMECGNGAVLLPEEQIWSFYMTLTWNNFQIFQNDFM